jgi:hypothetical protein
VILSYVAVGHGKIPSHTAELNQRQFASIGEGASSAGFISRATSLRRSGGGVDRIGRRTWGSGSNGTESSIEAAFIAVFDPGPGKRAKPDRATSQCLRTWRRSRALVLV